MRRLTVVGVVTLLLLMGSTPSAAATEVHLTQVDGTPGLVAVAARPGTRTLYLAQQDGVIWTLRNGKRSSTPAIDLREQVSQDGGERGLLGLAFSPDGDRAYVHYSDRNGDTQVDELTMQGRNPDSSSRRSVLSVEQPQANHNGGQLAFGPDGLLYLGLGDGGGAGDSGAGHATGGNGQSLGTVLGKILRIDPTPSATNAYTVPADNPFVGGDGEPEIWAFGLRNPWRFSFDRATGDLWIGDVGQNAYEEISRSSAANGLDAGRGDNYGWNRLEGAHPYRGDAPENAVPPVYEIDQDTGACAVVGGYVYRGAKIPELQGTYLFSDNCDGMIRMLVPDGTGGVAMHESGVELSAVASFGESNNGELYVVSLTDGLFRVDAS
jgi:glucose/arabinose dehydrogenase